MNVLQDSLRHRTEISTQPANRIKHVMKNADGSLSLTFGSGIKGKIDAKDEILQAFAVFSILAEV